MAEEDHQALLIAIVECCQASEQFVSSTDLVHRLREYSSYDDWWFRKLRKDKGGTMVLARVLKGYGVEQVREYISHTQRQEYGYIVAELISARNNS